jgi:hypothetical protein
MQRADPNDKATEDMSKALDLADIVLETSSESCSSYIAARTFILLDQNDDI